MVVLEALLQTRKKNVVFIFQGISSFGLAAVKDMVSQISMKLRISTAKIWSL